MHVLLIESEVSATCSTSPDWLPIRGIAHAGVTPSDPPSSAFPPSHVFCVLPVRRLLPASEPEKGIFPTEIAREFHAISLPWTPFPVSHKLAYAQVFILHIISLLGRHHDLQYEPITRSTHMTKACLFGLIWLTKPEAMLENLDILSWMTAVISDQSKTCQTG